MKLGQVIKTKGALVFLATALAACGGGGGGGGGDGSGSGGSGGAGSGGGSNPPPVTKNYSVTDLAVETPEPQIGYPFTVSLNLTNNESAERLSVSLSAVEKAKSDDPDAERDRPEGQTRHAGMADDVGQRAEGKYALLLYGPRLAGRCLARDGAVFRDRWLTARRYIRSGDRPAASEGARDLRARGAQESPERGL